MKQCLGAALVILCLVGCKTEPRACVKMKELCSTELEDCKELRASTQENFGDSAVDKLDGCVLQASSCSEAVGCTTGEAAKAAVEAVKGFAKGFEKAIKEAEPTR